MSKRRALATLLLLTGVVAVLTTLSYQRDVRSAYARINGGSVVAETPCGQIEYAIAGQGTPVLIVHGSGGGFDQGLLVLEPLLRPGLQLIAMSRFGYLRTPLPQDATAQAQADAHACLLDALGIDRAAIIGASAGAPSTLQFSLRHPERVSAMVLLVPATYAPRPDDAPALITPSGTEFLFDTALKSDFLFWVAPKVARTSVLRAILATPPELLREASAQERARVDAMIEHILPVRPRRQGLINDAAVTSRLTRYELEWIVAPTLIFGLEDDLFGTHDAALYSAEHIPGARFVSYPDGGHVWVGRQDVIMRELADFLLTHTP